MTQEEIAGKTSFHGSGIVNLSTRTSGVRDRYHIKPPSEGFDALPLALVLPMDPRLYPATQEGARTGDMFIPIDDDRPFAVLFHLIAPNTELPLVVRDFDDKYGDSKRYRCLLGDVELHAWKYRPRGYQSWLDVEGTLIADAQGQDARWPLVA